MAAINADPDVMRHFPAVQSEEETRGFIERNQAMQAERGHCYFAAELRATGEVVGFIGLAYQDYEADFTPCVDIGWRLSPKVWGKGLATEGARACLDFAFNDLRLAEVVAIAVLANTPSIRVMEKIGMKHKGTFMHPALADFPKLKKCVLYRLEHTSCRSGFSPNPET